MIQFTGERIVPEADNCEPRFAEKMYQEHIARYAFAAQWINGKRVLDVGCGVGYGSRWMAENGAKSVLAFDISEGAIKHAHKYYGSPKVNYQVASATNFNFDEHFDVVTCFELIEHVEEQSEVIERIRFNLKEDGILIISTPRSLAAKRTHFHTHEFSEQEFRALLEKKFPHVRFFFENNHFSSLIADHEPSLIDHVVPLHNQFGLSQADYFIAIASPANPKINSIAVKPTLILNNDQYVTLLERDVTILHESEDKLRQALGESEATLSTTQQTLAEREVALRATQQTLAEREVTLNITQRALEQTKERAAHFQNLLRAMEQSSSWKLMAPYRSIGHQLKQHRMLLRNAFNYQKQNGSKALTKALLRRLRQGKKTNPLVLSGMLSTSSLELVQPQNARSPIAEIENQFFNVIFAIGCWEGESKRYRVYNIADGLKELGYTVYIISSEDVAHLASYHVKADIVVLFRAPYDEVSQVGKFVNYAKGNGIKVVFDVDDLIFEPEIINQIDGYRLLNPEQQQQYIEGVHAYRKLLMAADIVTVPTEYLRQRVEGLGQHAFVIPNSINLEQLKVAAQLGKVKKEASDPIRIGYFSGSRTHQADFAECADALFDLMHAHPEVILRIVGFLDLDERWQSFSNRIEKLNFQPYQEMLYTLNDCDINLAPLEINSLFCHGKSELKFFEAGLLGIPTVASATDTHLRAINQHVDGFCAKNSEEWSQALETLIESSSLRKSIGNNAKQKALEHFSFRTVAEQAARLYGLRPRNVALSQNRDVINSKLNKLHIAWVVPELIIGGGGHRNILRAAYYLSSFGHAISLYFNNTQDSPETIRLQIQNHFYPLDCPVYRFEGWINQPVDVVFATHWSTVAAALTARDNAKEIIYFVQDFEPAFAPMGTEYVLAENTYRLGLYHITSGPWCEVKLRRDFNAEADHFQFPVDRSIYYPRPRTKENKNLIFFAKPEMPRRCFELGLMALSEFHRLQPDVEIIMFGSKHASLRGYDFPVTIREVLPTLDDLAEMYSNGDVGLVFSTTNPSLIPYEMMACGLPVIDLDRGDNAVNYGNRTDIAFLANPLPERMAKDIALLINNTTALEVRSKSGMEFVGKFPTEEEMARRIEALILKRLSQS